ncbi:MAG: hypothetical protein ASUL_02989 [Candidatus Aramenus sulfurataquae]|uniref:DUF929 domain-containing protein n=1 Tax=Candidatus Aramenus sulfurataquae TaxID=1326980 RepID=W7KKS6_9CREN|nr:MAG: hypothetical protein ASUL_02989 [Candidatus Aramenus sulfurataquae]
MTAKKRKEKKESKLIYVPFVLLAVFIALFFSLPYLHQSSSSSTVTQADSFGTLIKVSNKGYSNSTHVYFISWYGCPFGATLSWPLYLALSHYGYLNVSTHYSIIESDIGAPVPGLIFNGFVPNSTVQFTYLYIYNQYLNATPSGQPIPESQLIQVGLQEINSSLPSWIGALIYQWEVENPNFGFPQPIALLDNHIPSTLIITGPNGTWLMVGYPYMLTPQELLQINPSPTSLYHQIESGNVPPQIAQAENYILQVISEAQ